MLPVSEIRRSFVLRGVTFQDTALWLRASSKCHDAMNVVNFIRAYNLQIASISYLAESTTNDNSLTMVTNRSWSFDVGSSMILLGNQEEIDYRLMQHCLLECVTSAPVTDLQSYMRSFSVFTEIQGPEYISPFGCKRVPLRDNRLFQCMKLRGLLKDGSCSVYRIPANSHGRRSKNLFCCLLLWKCSSRLIFGSILTAVFVSSRTTWLEISRSASLSAF